MYYLIYSFWWRGKFFYVVYMLHTHTFFCFKSYIFAYIIVLSTFYKHLSESWCWLLPWPLSIYRCLWFYLSNFTNLWLHWMNYEGKIKSNCSISWGNLTNTFAINSRIKIISMHSEIQNIMKNRIQWWNEKVMCYI